MTECRLEVQGRGCGEYVVEGGIGTWLQGSVEGGPKPLWLCEPVVGGEV